MIHLTCLTHLFHQIGGTIRAKFPKVELIYIVKKKFLKAPKRVKIFKNMYPVVILPPQPIITKWDTWLIAVYCLNIQEIKVKYYLPNSIQLLQCL